MLLKNSIQVLCGVNVKGFYLLLYSQALRTISLSLLDSLVQKFGKIPVQKTWLYLSKRNN